MRLADKVAIVVGAGQQPGQTIGNGRATALRFAAEGAEILLVDKDEASAADTLAMITDNGGRGSTRGADVTSETDCQAIAETCLSRHGRIDILHNNVGRSEGDRETTQLPVETWDALMAMNLKGMFMTCKHVLPAMRNAGRGAIVNVSSTSSTGTCPTLTYKTSKGAVNTMTQHMALENAPYGVRVNAILTGLMDTPMAIERRARERGVDQQVIRDERNAQIPLGGMMGTSEDVANAALFLASDEARFVSGVLLLVDGARSCKVG